MRSSATRVAKEAIWMTNIAYLQGYYGVRYNAQTRQLLNVNSFLQYNNNNRYAVNIILPTLQNRAARLIKNPPRYDVLPESMDPESKEAAELSLDILNALWNKLEIQPKRIPLMMWLQQCGTSYLKVAWDPNKGKMIQDPSDQSWEREGDIRVDICSPFEIFCNPHAKEFSDVLETHMTHARVRPLDYFRKQYPERGKLVKQESTWLLSLQYEQRANNFTQRGPVSGSAQYQEKNSAIELIRYEAPSSKYPYGRMICTANGILLEEKELPIGEIPFAQFKDVEVGGKLDGESLVTHIRPLQDQKNELIKRRAEWIKKMMSGKLLAARGSGLMHEALTDDTAEILYYTPVPTANNNGEPTPLQMPQIPAYAYTDEERIDRNANDITGISEVSRGTLPSAGIPAMGMQLLVEQDDTRIGIVTEQHEHSYAKLGHYILRFVEEFYITPRQLKMGTRGKYMVKDVVGQSLKGHTDVLVVRGSTAPSSKTLRRQEIINLHQQGYFGEPKDPSVIERVAGMLEYGEVTDAWVDYNLNMQQVQRAIKILEEGYMPEMHKLDDHILWIRELNRYRKSEKWITLSPEVQNLFNQCIDQSATFLADLSDAQKMPPPPNAQMALEKINSGGPGGPPAPHGGPPQ